ncbi:MAG: carbon monoxide dehydrogenase, partial [Candidatus Omnitrophota bacterium]
MDKSKNRSYDPASQRMIKKAEEEDIKISWDRYDAMQPQCGFGQLGICCRVCNMGPCRIDPFGQGPQEGVCGATKDTIAARNLARMIASGAAAHSDHGRDIAHTLLLAAQNKVHDYEIKDSNKLRKVAQVFGIETDNKTVGEIACELAKACLSEFGKQEGTLQFLSLAPAKRQAVWSRLSLNPRGVDREVVEIMHRTHMGVDNDYKNIIGHAIRTALADGWGGSMIATELSDILFGSPEPIRATVNLGVLKKDYVNIVVHGHEPGLSEVILTASKDKELVSLAKKYKASGINIVG